LDVTELELFTKEIRIKTKGNNDIKDITPLVGEEIKRTGLKEGNVTLFVVGSTGAASQNLGRPKWKRPCEGRDNGAEPGSTFQRPAATAWNLAADCFI
jgi:hypothetical protein